MTRLKTFITASVYGIMLLGLVSSNPISAKTSIQIKLPMPKAKIEKFEVEKISLRDITFLFHISIDNPYPVDLRLNGIDLEFFIEGNTLFRTSTSKGFTIKKNGKKTNIFSMTLIYEDMVKIVKAFNEKEYLDCDIDMAIHIPLPYKEIRGLPKEITLDFKLHRKIPAVRPKVEIVNFKVHPPTIGEIETSMKKKKKKGDARQIRDQYEGLFSGRRSKNFDPAELDLIFNVSFDIVITNATKAKLEFRTLKYDFYVNRDPLLAGNTDRVQRSENQIRLTIMNQFSTRHLSQAVISAFEKRKGDYYLTGMTYVSFPSFVSKTPVPLYFDENGSFNLK